MDHRDLTQAITEPAVKAPMIPSGGAR